MIYVCNLFILSNHIEFENYADDITHFVYGNTLTILFLRPLVCKLINMKDFIIKSSNDSNLSFSEHVHYLCAIVDRNYKP